MLWFVGSVLVFGGLLALLLDYITGPFAAVSQHATQYMLTILLGASILFMTAMVYRILPMWYSHRRIEALRSYYPETRSGVAAGLLHDVRESLQSIMFNSELLSERVNYAIKSGIVNEKVEQMHIAEENLRLIRANVDRLECQLEELKHTLKVETEQPHG